MARLIFHFSTCCTKKDYKRNEYTYREGIMKPRSCQLPTKLTNTCTESCISFFSVSENYGDAMGVCRYNVEGNGNEAVSRDK